MKKLNKKTSKLKVNKYQFAGQKDPYSLGSNSVGTSASPMVSEEDIAEAELKMGRALTNTEKTQLAIKKAQDANAEAQQANTESAAKSGLGSLAMAAAKDKDAGILGKFFVPKAPIDAGMAAKTAFDTAATAAPTAASAGYAAPITVAAPYATEGASLIGSASLAPDAAATAVDLTSNTASAAGAAGSTASSTAATAASALPELSGLATAGIGLGLNIGGRIIENKADDENPFTYNNKEGRGNVLGSTMKSAGTGVGLGAAIGSFIPGVGNVIGGAVGGLAGGIAGLIKGKKENEQAEKTKEELWEDQARQASAYNSGFIRSRTSGPETGFGYQGSPNMNMQSTNSFYAKLGGVKPLPGGYEVPIGPNGEVKYIGNTHKQGGILESPTTEVENNETKDMVLMKKGGDTQPKEYFFSEYLKLGGKSFAKIHESMVKKGASQKQIQDLAEKQEKVAGRNPKQIAAYGGVRKYQVAGEKETAVPQMAYDINKPLLGKESMTTEEYDAAVTKYGLGVVDPFEATYKANEEYLNANKNTLTLQNAEDNQNNLFDESGDGTATGPLSGKYLSTKYDKDYATIIGYETSKGKKEREAAATVIKEGATETKDKLIGARDPRLLPQFENAKKNPIWAPENYGTWRNKVNTALNDEATATKVAEYIETYAASKEPFAEQVKRRAAGKTGAELIKIIREEATDNQPGIFHEAVRLALENAKPKDEPKKEDVKVEDVKDETPQPPLEPRFTACPPGQYRNENGVCVAIPKGDIKEGINKSLLFGALQMVPAGYAMLNPYKAAAPIATGPAPASVKGAVLPRVNMNQERAAGIQMARGMQTAIQNQNAGPGGIAAMMATNSKLSDQMLQIASQEQRANLQLAAEEARLGQQASQFNVESGLKSDAMRADIAQFNKKLEVGEKQYKREERLGALEAGVRGAAGIYRDQLQYKAQDRLARAVDETGSYDRFDFIEKALKDRKKKSSPYYGMSEYDITQIAAERFPVNVVAEAPKKPKESKEADNKKKGGVKRYVSRLGQLNYNKTKI